MECGKSINQTAVQALSSGNSRQFHLGLICGKLTSLYCSSHSTKQTSLYFCHFLSEPLDSIPLKFLPIGAGQVNPRWSVCHETLMVSTSWMLGPRNTREQTWTLAAWCCEAARDKCQIITSPGFRHLWGRLGYPVHLEVMVGAHRHQTSVCLVSDYRGVDIVEDY